MQCSTWRQFWTSYSVADLRRPYGRQQTDFELFDDDSYILARRVFLQIPQTLQRLLRRRVLARRHALRRDFRPLRGRRQEHMSGGGCLETSPFCGKHRLCILFTPCECTRASGG